MNPVRGAIWIPRGFAIATSFVVLLALAHLRPASESDAGTPAAGLECRERELEVVAIDRVWSAHPADFALLTHGEHQFIGYFDANRQMSFAHRRLGTSAWSYRKVDSWLGWDSHDYVTLAVDEAGHLHAAGNMHDDGLEYFYAPQQSSLRHMRRVATMIDPDSERRMSYPAFLREPEDRLLFRYRDGKSGDGLEIYNVYDAARRRWSRWLDVPLIDGQGKRSAYLEGPLLDPHGTYHVVWVWRDTSDAATNHDLSYARSRDLVHWTDSSGAPLTRPITQGEIVDPVPVGGGLLNNNARLGFDREGNPLIAYMKLDEDRDTQIYVARREAQGWRQVKITDWDGYRWEFGGRGSLVFEVEVLSGPFVLGEERIGVPVRRQERTTLFHLDADTLSTIAQTPYDPYPGILNRWSTASAPTLDGLELRFASDLGSSDEPETSYYLTWETLPPHRDRPRSSIPPPSTLRLHEVEAIGKECFYGRT